MELTAVVILAGALAAMSAAVTYLTWLQHRGCKAAPELPAADDQARTETGLARPSFDVVRAAAGYELRLAGASLMNLHTASEIAVAKRQPITGSAARFVSSLLQQASVVEVLLGERFVIARVPQAIREGGRWIRTADGTLKAIAVEANSSRIAAIPSLVRGGAAVGTAFAVAPALVASALAAYTQHRIEAAIEDVGLALGELSDRIRDADLGVVLGAQDLLREVSEWGPAHGWPEQLRWELAVRRAALDPVWYSLQRELERTVKSMVKSNSTFVGLPSDERDELRRKSYELTLALLVRAQLDYSTAMVLLDSPQAPYGLERLERIEQSFRSDLSALQTMFDTALNGSRPMPLSPARRRAKQTEAHVRGVVEYLVARINELEHPGDEALVLSLDASGTLVVEALPTSEAMSQTVLPETPDPPET